MYVRPRRGAYLKKNSLSLDSLDLLSLMSTQGLIPAHMHAGYRKRFSGSSAKTTFGLSTHSGRYLAYKVAVTKIH
jgi:hypothetical protein